LSDAGALPAWGLVVAAGSGERLGSDRPKAFVRLGERTLLAASLEVFEEHPGIDGVVCVVPAGWEERTTLLVDDLCAGKIAAAVTGGPTRAESVARGLDEVPDSAAFVLVHDAARPLVSGELIDRVLQGLAGGADGVVPALPLTDTVKRVRDGAVAETLDRSELVAVQTPQGFPADVLRRAIAAAGGELAGATDCASLVERAGGRVVCVEGDALNLKVTTRDDLRRCEQVLAWRGPGRSR
jgi:2-C-methyl-D-erythritol 4-phosphate cytidylyltransferase